MKIISLMIHNFKEYYYSFWSLNFADAGRGVFDHSQVTRFQGLYLGKEDSYEIENYIIDRYYQTDSLIGVLFPARSVLIFRSGLFCHCYSGLCIVKILRISQNCVSDIQPNKPLDVGINLKSPFMRSARYS